MKLVIGKQEISKVMQISQNIVEKKTTMPILQNALLEAKKGTLTISSSDIEISVISKVKANIIEQGKTTIGAKIFAEAIRRLPEEDVILELEEGEILNISSSSGDTTIKLNCIGAESFPKLPIRDIEAKHQVKASELLAMIDKTFFAVANNESRWSLNGIYLKKEDGGHVCAVATDGHRLAITTRKISMPFLKEGIIIPKKGVSELKKILEDQEDGAKVNIDITDSYLVVETENEKIGMRLIDATYPDYSYAIPQGRCQKIELNTGKISASLDMMAYMNSEKDKKMLLHFEDKTLVITSTNPGLGEAKSIIKDISYKGEDLDLGFNPKFLLDIVTNLSDENVVFEIYGKLKPIKIYSPKDESSVAYLMPMRIKAS